MRRLFEQEYTKHEKAFYLVALCYLHNAEDAKDALQDAAISAYKAFPLLQNIGHFKTWMTRIVINKCKDALRRRHEMLCIDDVTGLFSHIPHEELEILDAVCRLDRRQSIFITLKYYNDMTYEEMAKVLHLPLSTVKYRTKNAVASLKKLMEGDV